ncbi:MAG: NAD(P)-dependent oxidoreductase [Steroidobacter sp.]
MRVVVVHHNPASAQRWRDALARELPDADVAIWKEGSGGDARYAVGWAAPSPFFAEQPQLRAFFSTGAGVERLLASASLPATLPVIRLEDAGMGAQITNYCIGETLHWMRRRDEYAEHQRAHIWRQLPEEDMADWPIGVFGLGVLGQRVASAFAALGFTVNGYARSVRTDAQITCFAESGEPGNFSSFLKATRVLIILAPLTPATQDRFDHAALGELPTGSFVINVARGGLLVDDALLDLLDSDHLAGAALDVFRQEPLPSDHRFWTHPKIRITPHISAITMISPSARQIAQKIRRLERAESVSGVVDRTRGY